MINKLGMSVLVASVFAISSLSLAKEKEHPYKDHMKGHPRQNEVNKRLDNQANRVNRQEQNGKVTQQQAEKMEGQDQKIYNQEQADKAKNGGDYITKGQQAKLNREENRV